MNETQGTSRNIPTVLILFGATGDLASKKIIPAMFHLHKKQVLPKLFHVLAHGRRQLTEEEFCQKVYEDLTSHKDVVGSEKELKEFAKLFKYIYGDAHNEELYEAFAIHLGYIDKEWKVCSNKLFYLSVAPQFYHGIFEQIRKSGLAKPCGPEEGWTRIIVEKPFGNDLTTAEKLDEELGKSFKEEQIYRIDHYLGKEMLQNILTWRFANNILESSWNAKHIESITLRLNEDIDIGTRGESYDGVGAFKDVGQNHILQMLALVTMEAPKDFSDTEIRKQRTKILKSLKPLTPKQIKDQTQRFQYKGYRKVDGVESGSNTETYFRIKAQIDTPRWRGVDIIMEAGKATGDSDKEIMVTFRHPEPCMCPPDKHIQNSVHFNLNKPEGVTIDFFAKKPGFDMFDLAHHKFEACFSCEDINLYAEAYEKLLLDCFMGNQTLFVSTKEVAAMWEFVDPIIRAWQKDKVPLQEYKPGTTP